MAATATPEPETIATVSPFRSTKPTPAAVKDLVKMLWFQGISPSAIAVETGVKRETISTWAKRGNWTSTRDNGKQLLKRKAQVTMAVTVAREVSRESAEVRNLLAGAVRSQAERLAASPPASVKELANTPDRQGLAAVLKTVVDSASEVFDWQSQHTPGVVVLQDLRSSEPGEQVIDIAAATDPVTDATDTPSNSVPGEPAKLDTTPDPKTLSQDTEYQDVMSQLLGA